MRLAHNQLATAINAVVVINSASFICINTDKKLLFVLQRAISAARVDE